MDNNIEKARGYAIYLLKLSDKTYKEIYTKLTKKGFSFEIATLVSNEMQERGYISDLNFAKNYILQKSKYANFGKKRIIIDLIKKGISKDNILIAFEELNNDDEINELESAKEALFKKTKGSDDWKLDFASKKKIYDFLLRRGFSYDIIRRL